MTSDVPAERFGLRNVERIVQSWNKAAGESLDLDDSRVLDGKKACSRSTRAAGPLLGGRGGDDQQLPRMARDTAAAFLDARAQEALRIRLQAGAVAG